MVSLGPTDEPECRHGQATRARCAVCSAPDVIRADRLGEPDDDRWEWIETTTFGGRPEWVKGRCNHVPDSRVPVDAYPTGELIAWLCSDCGEEFDADRWPLPEGMWRRIPEKMLNSPMTLHKQDGQLQFVVEFVVARRSLPDRLYGAFDAVWNVIKGAAVAAVLSYPLWIVAIWYFGTVLGWWD